MSNPRVSIVVPAYNGADYLGQAIDSALQQTAPSVEVLVINDGSTDGGATASVARSYGHRIRYIEQPNGGVSRALNRGLAEMRGEWFAWLSHDDLFAANRIESDLHLIATAPNTRVTFCPIVYIGPDRTRIGEPSWKVRRVTNPREALLQGGVDMCAMTIHRSCFDIVGRFDESSRTNQDVIMSLRLAKHFPFELNRDTVTLKREHPQRGTRTMTEARRRELVDFHRFLEEELRLEDLYPDLGDDPDEKSQAWLWRGDMLRGFGAVAFARQSYQEAVRAQPRLLGRARVRARLAAHTFFRTVGALRRMR